MEQDDKTGYTKAKRILYYNTILVAFLTIWMVLVFRNWERVEHKNTVIIAIIIVYSFYAYQLLVFRSGKVKTLLSEYHEASMTEKIKHIEKAKKKMEMYFFAGIIVFPISVFLIFSKYVDFRYAIFIVIISFSILATGIIGKIAIVKETKNVLSSSTQSPRSEEVGKGPPQE